MNPYLVVVEPAEDGSFSAFVADLPGCVACGNTFDEASALIGEAIHLHVESMQAHGETIPEPSSRSGLGIAISNSWLKSFRS